MGPRAKRILILHHYTHKKHQTEFIVKKFDIHSRKESKGNF